LIDYETHRSRRLAQLTADDGWLTVVAQALLEEGKNEVPEVGLVELQGDRARTGSVVLEPEALVPFGDRTLQLVERAGRFALRVRDPQSAARLVFRGLPYFEIAPEWRIPARLVPGPTRLLEMLYTIGTTGTVPSPGTVEFQAGGETHRLDALDMGDRLLLVFGDETNGKETYGGGRVLWLEAPVEVVDFNLAENPACVFTEHALCPLPSRQNSLPLRVEAGEQVPR
jgi:uncharacterized protein (DUF1684 family)